MRGRTPLGPSANGRMLAKGSAQELRRQAGRNTLEEAFLYYASM